MCVCMCHCEVVCVCVSVAERREGVEENRKVKRGGEIKAEQWQRGKRERHRRENMPSFPLSPSLPHSPTRGSKYNDHRKVISKLSQ